MSWTPDTSVILVNLGTPTEPSRAAVARFLGEFLSDRRVVELPRLLWWPVLHGIVIPLRAGRVARAYQSIWNGDSPLRRISQSQQQKLQQAMRESHGDKAPLVQLAMNYQGPSLRAAWEECRRRGISRVVVLPLFPQYSASTSGVVYDQLSRVLRRERALPHLRIIRDYHDHPAYIAALARSVTEARQREGAGQHLLISCHGLPERNVMRGDPYVAQCRRTAALLAAELGLAGQQWSLSFQSRFGRAKWVGPATDAALTQLARGGVSSVDVICPAFAADCLETLDEIAVENRHVFVSNGGTGFRYIPCLNDRDDHIAMMQALLRMLDLPVA